MSCQAMKKHGEKCQCILSNKIINLKSYFSMIPTLWHSGKSKSMEPVKRSVVVWMEGHHQEKHRGFLEPWNTLCGIYWWIHIIYLSKPIEDTTSRMSPKINYGLYVMWRCRFISGNKCTILVRDVDNGGGPHAEGSGYMGNLCTLLTLLLKT